MQLCDSSPNHTQWKHWKEDGAKSNVSMLHAACAMLNRSARVLMVDKDQDGRWWETTMDIEVKDWPLKKDPERDMWFYCKAGHVMPVVLEKSLQVNEVPTVSRPAPQPPAQPEQPKPPGPLPS